MSSDIINLTIKVYKYNSFYKLYILVETKQIIPVNTVATLGVLSSNIFNGFSCIGIGHDIDEYGIIAVNDTNKIQLRPLKITNFSWFKGMIIK